ncbi:phenylacetate--CoA ligase family protein [Alcaligenes sp. SDU_A2]|uniref:phenylacetate--CoA ligase family protein n=1 Tax=Alcaligenes sp. SDU_A2 TaxID=3136634 RepID=UPI002CACCFAE|nr:AMP-binding protein [Alcaligenes sp.]HRL26248.1 AMP-binding protein [Alcaligenes sp.]
MSDYYDERETLPAQQREQELMARLPQVLQAARQRAPAIAVQLQGVDIAAVRSREDLSAIPVIRKSELLQAQLRSREQARTQGGAGRQAQDVFGGFSAIGWGQARKVFASPGPMYEPESARPDYWGFARALYAAGFRRDELIYNCFSYHFTPAGSMMETAAHALGCTVFPGGIGQTEQQVQAMADLMPGGYTGTPSFLKIILEKAQSMQVALPSLGKALFSGEAYPPSLQQWFAGHGIDGYQAYGSADLGMIAYETAAREGLVLNEGLILEIVRPGTGHAVEPGEVGEVVVTSFNPDYPLVRFGTGDLSALLPGVSPCGRTNQRIRGWMGRADQTTKVRGMFVHPAQVEQIRTRHPELGQARLVVRGATGQDQMVFQAEIVSGLPGLEQAVAETIRDVTKLRAQVELLAPDTLPRDGKVIEDQRSYD